MTTKAANEHRRSVSSLSEISDHTNQQTKAEVDKTIAASEVDIHYRFRSRGPHFAALKTQKAAAPTN